MHASLMMYEAERILKACSNACAGTDHGETLCYRTRATEIEKNHNNTTAFERSWVFNKHSVTPLRVCSSKANTILRRGQAAVSGPIL